MDSEKEVDLSEDKFASAKYVIVSSYNTPSGTYLKLSAIKGGLKEVEGKLGDIIKLETTSKQDVVPAINEIVDDIDGLHPKKEDIEVDLSVNLETGFAFNGEGTTVNKDFSRNKIPVKKGDVITVTCAGYNTILVMIGKWISGSGTSAKCVPYVRSTSSDIDTYTYTAEEDFDMCVSYNNNRTRSVYITREYSGIEERVTTVEMEIIKHGEQISELSGKIDLKSTTNFGNIFKNIAVIGDSLSSSKLDGAYWSKWVVKSSGK